MHIIAQKFAKSEDFENRSFFFAPWLQGRECVLIIKACIVDSNLGTIQKN